MNACLGFDAEAWLRGSYVSRPSDPYPDAPLCGPDSEVLRLRLDIPFENPIGELVDAKVYCDEDGSGPKSEYECTAEITFSSTQNDVIHVDSQGVLHAQSPGETFIQAHRNGHKTIPLRVHTIKLQPTLRLRASQNDFNIGESIILRAFEDPDGPAGPRAEVEVTNNTFFVSLQENIASVASGSNLLQGHAHGLVEVLGITNNWSSLNTIQVEVREGPMLALQIIKGEVEVETSGTWNLKKGKRVEVLVTLDPDGNGPASAKLLSTYTSFAADNRNLKISRYSRRKHSRRIMGRNIGTSIISVEHITPEGRILKLEKMFHILPRR